MEAICLHSVYCGQIEMAHLVSFVLPRKPRVRHNSVVVASWRIYTTYSSFENWDLSVYLDFWMNVIGLFTFNLLNFCFSTGGAGLDFGTLVSLCLTGSYTRAALFHHHFSQSL